METVPIFLFVLVVFANRYVFGLFFRILKGRRFDVTRDDYEPVVTIVVPLFNEGHTIYDTIVSLVSIDYPPEKLSITVVDDCSTDDSYEWACRAARIFPDRVRVLQNPHNMGKRMGINHAVREAWDAEIIVSVDSDVIVDPGAVRALVARFTADDIAAVGGRVHVSNANENWLSRMQTIKYFFGQELLKNLERTMQSVMCLSGCLTAYRRSVLVELEPILENRNVFGVAIKYGEDRFLTRQIVKAGYRTLLTMDAFCYTKAPTTLTGYFNQQLRWKRSNIIDFTCGLSHAWRLHPLVGVHYMSMFALLLVYPFLIIAHLVSGDFISLVAFHVGLVAVLGFIYHFAPSTRRLDPQYRVHPFWFLPMAVLMPTAYLVLTPLGMFTLHSSSWETRGHTAVVVQGAEGGTPS
jgi:cellulose synthase/poly-beta-1,6-N-acetylglucosamine synthase-like glycosyltransferase